jgi:hypothetical protein
LVSIVAVRLGDGIFSLATGEPGVLQPQWAPAFAWMAGFGGTGLALMYLAVSAAGVKGLWDQVNRTKLVIAASAGILVSAGAIFGAIYKAASPLNSVPWALGIWIVLGAVWSIIAVRRSSDTTESGPKTDALAANPSGLG